MTLSAEMLVLVAAVFLLAGCVKGVIGLGLPTVSLGVLTAASDLTTAMALMVVPSFATNLWQAAVGGHLRPLLVRLWPFLLAAVLGVGAGAQAIGRVDVTLLSALLGLSLVMYSALALGGVRLEIGSSSQRWAGPACGLANGVLTGMTGSFVVPGVMFLQAIGLPRDALVQAMGIVFTVSTVAVGVALGANAIWTSELALVSTAALAPAVAGMVLGARLRRRLTEAVFRRVFFVSILALGCYIVLRAGVG